MRNLTSVFYVVVIFSIVSCRNSSDVISNSKFQKRKYTQGWYVERNSRSQQEGLALQRKVLTEVPHNSVEENIEQEDEARSEHLIDEIASASLLPEVPAVRAKANKFVGSENELVHNALKKRKKSKERFVKGTVWARNSAALSTWFIGWPVHLPIITISLAGIAILLAIMTLSKLKKGKKRNKRWCYIVIFVSIVFVLLAILI